MFMIEVTAGKRCFAFGRSSGLRLELLLRLLLYDDDEEMLLRRDRRPSFERLRCEDAGDLDRLSSRLFPSGLRLRAPGGLE